MSQYDKMTKTPVEKLIILLSIPTIISMLVTNIYNLVDTAFVGKLGNSASGAVGIVFGFMAILQAIGFLFGQGAGSIISRKLGSKDIEAASQVASTGFFTAFVLAVIVSAVSFVFLDSIIIFLGSTSTIAPYAKTYISFILITAPFMVTTFTLNNILRYEGKAMLGMIGLLSGAVLNIGGDAIFMFGLKMEIAGAGLSTAISQVVSFSILLSSFIRGKTQTKISVKKIQFKWSMYGEILGTGLPSLLRQGLNSICTILLNSRAAFYGDTAVAAMSIVSRVFFFIFSISVGVGQGFQPVSGFNYGAKKFSRIRKAYRFTFILSEILMLILGTIVFFNAQNFVKIFRDDPTVIAIATRSLKLHCGAILFLPPCMVTEMLYQSTGRKLGAALLSSMRSGLILIPTLVLLSYFRGLSGIQEAQPLTFVLSLLPTMIFAYTFFKKLPEDENGNSKQTSSQNN